MKGCYQLPRTPTSWLRFSLGTIFLMIALVAIVLGLTTPKIRERRAM